MTPALVAFMPVGYTPLTCASARADIDSIPTITITAGHRRRRTRKSRRRRSAHPAAAAIRRTSPGCCRLAKTRASGISTANATIMTTVIMTTTFAIAEVLPGDDQCRSGIPLGGAQREHASRVCAGTAEDPANAEADER